MIVKTLDIFTPGVLYLYTPQPDNKRNSPITTIAPINLPSFSGPLFIIKFLKLLDNNYK